VLLATETAVDLSVQDVSAAQVMLLDLISAISVQSAELWAVLTQTGQLLVTLNSVAVLPQLLTVQILPWAIIQAHLTITFWAFVDAGAQPLRPQALHLLAAKSLHN
jgi:hypothetical protein